MTAYMNNNSFILPDNLRSEDLETDLLLSIPHDDNDMFDLNFDADDDDIATHTNNSSMMRRDSLDAFDTMMFGSTTTTIHGGTDDDLDNLMLGVDDLYQPTWPTPAQEKNLYAKNKNSSANNNSSNSNATARKYRRSNNKRRVAEVNVSALGAYDPSNNPANDVLPYNCSASVSPVPTTSMTVMPTSVPTNFSSVSNDIKRKQPHRVSCSDLSIGSYGSSNDLLTVCSEPSLRRPSKMQRRRLTDDSSAAPNLAQLLGYDNNGSAINVSNTMNEDSPQYQKHLQKLAQSMERTELSRRQVMMQRSMLENQIQQQQVQVQRQRVVQQQQQQTVATTTTYQNVPQQISQKSVNALHQMQMAYQPRRSRSPPQVRSSSPQQIQQQVQQQVPVQQQAATPAMSQLQQRMSLGSCPSPSVVSVGSSSNSEYGPVSPVMSRSSSLVANTVASNDVVAVEHRLVAFLSGNRRTLTDGLERSRRQLSMCLVSPQ